MDRRSWLWRRKSSEKSPGGETESSGSLSWHSDRFCDDQTSNNNNIQSSDESVSEKLSEALVNIRAKEDLVKQHAKVAEEAVSGWERAEKEVVVLKKQNEALTRKNLILEEHVDQLDGALKECLRQHRQQEEDNLENSSRQLSELQHANAMLEAAEKDKSILRLELEMRTRAAEAASKQHLDAMKRVAELEAECLQLKARTATIVPSADIYLMDDFLEMEKLVSLPESASELEAMINRTAELEDALKKITAEKVRLEIQLKASEDQLKITEVKLQDLKTQLALANEATANARKEVERTKAERRDIAKLLHETEKNVGKIQHQLEETNQAKMQLEEDANVKRAESEARLKLMEQSISTLEREVEKEKNVSRKAIAKCDILEAEMSRIKSAEFRINQDKEVAMAAAKFAECQKTIASLGLQLKSLATLDDFLRDDK